MTGYEQVMRHREASLEIATKELERLADAHAGSSHYLSQESYKLGIRFAIREIEGTEALMIKAHQELPYANPKEAEREHKNTMSLLRTIKAALVRRYESRP